MTKQYLTLVSHNFIIISDIFIILQLANAPQYRKTILIYHYQ